MKVTNLIKVGGLSVVFLGDEPHVGSLTNLARVANATRSSLDKIEGGRNVLIYMNHCSGGLERYGIDHIPNAIDIISLDGCQCALAICDCLLFCLFCMRYDHDRRLNIIVDYASL